MARTLRERIDQRMAELDATVWQGDEVLVLPSWRSKMWDECGETSFVEDLRQVDFRCPDGFLARAEKAAAVEQQRAAKQVARAAEAASCSTPTDHSQAMSSDEQGKTAPDEETCELTHEMIQNLPVYKKDQRLSLRDRLNWHMRQGHEPLMANDSVIKTLDAKEDCRGSFTEAPKWALIFFAAQNGLLGLLSIMAPSTIFLVCHDFVGRDVPQFVHANTRLLGMALLSLAVQTLVTAMCAPVAVQRKMLLFLIIPCVATVYVSHAAVSPEQNDFLVGEDEQYCGLHFLLPSWNAVGVLGIIAGLALE